MECGGCGRHNPEGANFCIYCRWPFHERMAAATATGHYAAGVVSAAAPSDGEVMTLERELPPFFPVSTVKLALLSIFTLNIYNVYWFYRNWAYLKEYSGRNIWPVPRAVFSVLFCYPLFKIINDESEEEGVGTLFNATAMAAIYIVLLVIANRAPEPFYLIGFLAFIPLLFVQKTVNALRERVSPQAEKNAGFSAWNIIVLLFGGLLTLLVVVASFLPDEYLEPY